MAKAYWVVTYRSVSDPAKLAAYGELAGPAIRASGGRFLTRGGKVTAREAGQEQRTVVAEFDSYEQAVAAYDTEAYQRALRELDGAAVRDVRIVEGVPGG
jgi:uncharacterized protein (DUF1330 family)